MALPSKYSIDKKLNSMDGLSAYENGGKGSGNWGHEGRPGYVGGSGRGVGASSLHESRQRVGSVEKEAKEAEAREREEAAYSEVMNPTRKLDEETLELGREAVNKAMDTADAKLRSGKIQPTVEGKPFDPWRKELKESGQTLATPLEGEVESDVISSVMGQLSDGIWENSPAMESYWRMCEPFRADDGKTYMRVSKKVDYLDYTDHRGYRHWKNNKYATMSNAGVRNFWGNKVKQVVDIERRDSKNSSMFKGDEDYSWRPDNKTELQYMHSYREGGKNPTVGDAYKVWAKLTAPKSAKLNRDPFDYREDNY